MRDTYLPDRDSITLVNVALNRDDAGAVDVRLHWVRCGVLSHAEVSHRLGIDLDRALFYAMHAVEQIGYWHTTISDVYATLAGENNGLSHA